MISRSVKPVLGKASAIVTPLCLSQNAWRVYRSLWYRSCSPPPESTFLSILLLGYHRDRIWYRWWPYDIICMVVWWNDWRYKKKLQPFTFQMDMTLHEPYCQKMVRWMLTYSLPIVRQWNRRSVLQRYQWGSVLTSWSSCWIQTTSDFKLRIKSILIDPLQTIRAW